MLLPLCSWLGAGVTMPAGLTLDGEVFAGLGGELATWPHAVVGCCLLASLRSTLLAAAAAHLRGSRGLLPVGRLRQHEGTSGLVL